MSEIAYSYLRFSSKKQATGDSLRRQLKAGEDYCAKYGLLLNPVNFKDLAVSAKEGKNAVDGALGEFIDCIEAGKIPKGSVLLLDEFSRLSRDKVPNALQLFLRLLNHVDIVTLANEKRYSLDTLDTTDLIITITIMARAHEENQNRIRNISAVKQEKHDQLYAGKLETKLTKQCPFWLTLSDDRKAFIGDDEKIKVVRQCFQKSLDGEGTVRIMTWLNETEFPAARGGKWGLSSMSRLLKNPQVLGHFQPIKNGVPAGPVIEDYYPQIIKPKVFYAVQTGRSGRSKGSSGPVSKTFPNLFKGVCKCRCGASMHYVTKGDYIYLLCANARFGKGCDYRSFRYDKIEPLLLNLLAILDYSQMEGDNSVELLGAIGELEEQIKVGRSQIVNFTTAIGAAESADLELLAPITKNLVTIGARVKEWETTLSAKSSELVGVTNSDPTETFKALKSETKEQRTLLNQFLKRYIKAIVFGKDGLSVVFNHTQAFLSVDLDAEPSPAMAKQLNEAIKKGTFGIYHVSHLWDAEVPSGPEDEHLLIVEALKKQGFTKTTT